MVLRTPGGNAAAAGFLVYDAAGEALGKGSAVTASVNDPSAVFFNPAALVFMEGQQFSVGGLWVTANADFYRIDINDRIVFSSNIAPEDASACSTPSGCSSSWPKLQGVSFGDHGTQAFS